MGWVGGEKNVKIYPVHHPPLGLAAITDCGLLIETIQLYRFCYQSVGS